MTTPCRAKDEANGTWRYDAAWKEYEGIDVCGACDRLWYVMQMALHLASPAWQDMASGSGLPVLEVHQAERDNCILAVSF